MVPLAGGSEKTQRESERVSEVYLFKKQVCLFLMWGKIKSPVILEVSLLKSSTLAALCFCQYATTSVIEEMLLRHVWK